MIDLTRVSIERRDYGPSIGQLALLSIAGYISDWCKMTEASVKRQLGLGRGPRAKVRNNDLLTDVVADLAQTQTIKSHAWSCLSAIQSSESSIESSSSQLSNPAATMLTLTA